MEDLPDLSPAGRERIARFKSRKESILSILQTPKVVKKKQGSWAKLPEMMLIAIWSRCLIPPQMQYPFFTTNNPDLSTTLSDLKGRQSTGFESAGRRSVASSARMATPQSILKVT